MRTRAIALCLAVSALSVAPLQAQDASDAAQIDKTSERIIAELDALEMPRYDANRRSDAEYRAQYAEQRRAHDEAQAELALQLYKADPTHERLVRLMPARWNLVARTDADRALREMEGAMKRADSPLAIEAAYTSAMLIGRENRYDAESFMPALKRFRKMAPSDDRAARLMMSAAGAMEGDAALAMYEEALKEFPESRSTRYAPGKVRQIEMRGKPFEFEFKDAISGATVSSKELRGKVLVIDFWATWCGPCIAEMPHMKEVYAEYKDKGVEFIGISLDRSEAQGGLEKLRAYCEENDIDWPQYYQGDYWDSEFSTSWGINGIPTMFIIDKKGNLHSTKARGKLEEMIPELLGMKSGGAG